MVDLIRTLAALVEPPTEGHGKLSDLLGLGPLPTPAEHADVFLFQAPPYASIYLGPDGMLGGVARERVAGFWRAVGQTPPAEPDHLTALLGLYASLTEASAAETEPALRSLLGQSAGALFDEHLVSWLGPYLTVVRDTGCPFYQRWADLLLDTVAAQRAARGDAATLSAHLRENPALPDPRVQGGPDFLEGLLSPGVSGMILTRAALARGAHQSGVGLRAGERRYALEAMLSQDAPSVLAWLSDAALAWSEVHESLAPRVGRRTAGFWSGRATSTASLLESLTRDARASIEGPDPCPR